MPLGGEHAVAPWYRDREFSVAHPCLPGNMTVSLIVDDQTADRLQEAFYDAFAGRRRQIPSRAVRENRRKDTSRLCRCVAPEVGRSLRLQGWDGGLIYVVTKEDFARRTPLLGPRDALLFHDVAPSRLRVAVRLAIARLTLFPSALVPEGEMAGPTLEGFERLSEIDRAVMAQLALGVRNQKIADRLGHSPKTVRQYVNRICRTLGCLNRTELALLAYSRFSPFLDMRET